MTGTFRPGRRLACLAVLAALPLTACAAGYQAETSRETTTLTSVSAAKGYLTLRNILFLGAADAGGTLPLHLSIFNGGPGPDKLVGISSVASSGGTLPKTTAVLAGGQLVFNVGQVDVPKLTGLKRKVLVGQTVNVTLTFALAGDIQITVPVEKLTPTNS